MDETTAAKMKLFDEISEFARQGEARDLKAKYAPKAAPVAAAPVAEGMDTDTLAVLEGMLAEDPVA